MCCILYCSSSRMYQWTKSFHFLCGGQQCAPSRTWTKELQNIRKSLQPLYCPVDVYWNALYFGLNCMLQSMPCQAIDGKGQLSSVEKWALSIIVYHHPPHYWLSCYTQWTYILSCCRSHQMTGSSHSQDSHALLCVCCEHPVHDLNYIFSQ
jgi:hypothetical protein